MNLKSLKLIVCILITGAINHISPIFGQTENDTLPNPFDEVIANSIHEKERLTGVEFGINFLDIGFMGVVGELRKEIPPNILFNPNITIYHRGIYSSFELIGTGKCKTRSNLGSPVIEKGMKAGQQSLMICFGYNLTRNNNFKIIPYAGYAWNELIIDDGDNNEIERFYDYSASYGLRIILQGDPGRDRKKFIFNKLSSESFNELMLNLSVIPINYGNNLKGAIINISIGIYFNGRIMYNRTNDLY